jgi:multicomponent Na+:H+ antiporter subunit C
MTLQTLLFLFSTMLLLLGILGFALKRDFLRRIIAFNLMSSGVLLLLAAFTQTAETEPLLTGVFVILFIVTTVLTALTLQMRNQLISRFHQSDTDGIIDSEIGP